MGPGAVAVSVGGGHGAGSARWAPRAGEGPTARRPFESYSSISDRNYYLYSGWGHLRWSSQSPGEGHVPGEWPKGLGVET